MVVSDCIYRWLLGIYPMSFRQDYGGEMAQLFRDCSRDACQQRGSIGLAGLWLHTLGDLVITVPREHLAELNASESVRPVSTAVGSVERSDTMPWDFVRDRHPFGERLAKVLDQKPAYYQLLISSEPTRRMNDIVESLAMDGDPKQPETTLDLFQELATDLPEKRLARWLTGLRDVAQKIYSPAPPDTAPTVTDKLLRLIYADPRLYELVAAVEPGYGLLDIVESLALEVDIDDVEEMLELMRQLVAQPQISASS
jgi:hypothetical protein